MRNDWFLSVLSFKEIHYNSKGHFHRLALTWAFKQSGVLSRELRTREQERASVTWWALPVLLGEEAAGGGGHAGVARCAILFSLHRWAWSSLRAFGTPLSCCAVLSSPGLGFACV